MKEVTKSTVVHVPVHTAYNQWTQFESYPQFMEGVKEVRQLDDKRLHWVANVGGHEQEWDALINEQLPDQLIAWHSTTGSENAGRVMFKPQGDDSCEVEVHIGYDPEGFTENVGDMLGFMSRRVEGDLERFKEFVEGRGSETGAWRGTIHRGEVGRTPGRP